MLMNKSGRSQLALGIILILVGGWFLLNQTMPEFRRFFEPYTEWPSNMLLIGAAILAAQFGSARRHCGWNWRYFLLSECLR